MFDAYWWVEGPPSLRHVLREIVFAWSRMHPGDELVLVVPRSHRDAAVRDAPPGARVRATSLWPQGLAAAVSAPSIARSTSADLVVTHNFACSSKTGVTAVYLHDLMFATNPEWFTLAERAYFSMMRLLLHRADLVFTSSETEAKRITAVTHTPRVLPVGLGLSTELTDAAMHDDADPELEPGQFLLSVGRLNTRKNLGATVDGAIRSHRISPQHPLVIVGSADGRQEALGASAKAALADGSVRFVGFVSDARLRWYYRNASLFVFLSLDEGFGMPAVEAAFFGCRVLVSDLAVFHENLDTRASYVDPRDVPAIATAIATALDSSDAIEVPRRLRGRVASQHDWSAIVELMRDQVLLSAPVKAGGGA